MHPEQSRDEGKAYFKEHYKKGLKQKLVDHKNNREKIEQEKAIAAKKEAEHMKLLKQNLKEKKKLKQQLEKDQENIDKFNDVIMTTQKTNPISIQDYDSEKFLNSKKCSDNLMDININNNQKINNPNNNNQNNNQNYQKNNYNINYKNNNTNNHNDNDIKKFNKEE
jgi:hypothetical protein